MLTSAVRATGRVWTDVAGDLLYASKAKAVPPVTIWSDELRVGTRPACMIELAEQVRLIEPEKR